MSTYNKYIKKRVRLIQKINFRQKDSKYGLIAQMVRAHA